MKADEKLFEALSNLDGLCAELEDISNLLAMYDENLTNDFIPLCAGKSWGGEHINGRWPLHLSTLNVIRLRLYDILEALQTNVTNGLKAFRKEGTENS